MCSPWTSSIVKVCELSLPGYLARLSVRWLMYFDEYESVGCKGWKSITERTLLFPREIRSTPKRGMSYSNDGYHNELNTY